MYIEEKKLKEFIVDSGLVSQADFAFAVRESKKRGQSISQTLVSEGKLRENDARQVQSYALGIPFVSFVGEKIDFSVLSLIPEPIARAHNIVAFKKHDDTSFEVAVLDIDDLASIEFIKKKLNLKITPRLTDAESIKSALLQYQKTLKEEFGNIISRESSNIKAFLSEKNVRKMAADAPATKIVSVLLKHALLQDASDIHIEPQEDMLLIRYRIDGFLHDAMMLPKESGTAIVDRIKMLSNLSIDERRLPQEGRFKIENDGQKLSLRVSVMPTCLGEKVVVRLVRENAHGFTLEYLGFHGENLERMYAATSRTAGMILAVGSSGSGKATTLYTLLDMLNMPDASISTIEDSIEYRMPRINQTQVRTDIGLSFAEGLRALVRQDSDIIMVGAIRDDETAHLAVNAARTGHLILSTLIAKSAAEALTKLIAMKVDPFALASTLSVVVGQRLVRRLSESCDRRDLSNSELYSLGKIVDMNRVLAFLRAEKIIDEKDDWKNVMFGIAKPTKEFPDGYSGNLGIHEVLLMTPTIRELMMRGAHTATLEAQAKQEGMMTMIEDAVFKAAQGLTSIEEVMRVVKV